MDDYQGLEELIASGLDVPTAIAASTSDSTEDDPQETVNQVNEDKGCLSALIAFFVRFLQFP